MPKVKIAQKMIAVGSQKIPLISGEVHYWRLNPNYWEEILTRVKEMGLDTVATYVPWDYHEHKKGQFDFTGKTDQTRNLKGFLELTRKMGFWVIIRPGPYIYSEWPNEGAPAYAYRYHRLHPKFHEYAETYLKNVMQVIRPYLASKAKGHILLLQADNEIDPWPDVHGPQYGLHGEPGLFQDFLRTLYQGDLNELNERWGTNYKSFDETGPFIATMLAGETGLALKGDHELRRNIDYLKFKYDFSKRVAEWSVRAYRKLGVDVPIYLNLYPFFYAHDWVDMQSASDMVGVDLYPTSELAEDRYEQRKFIDKIRYLKNVSTIPYIAEFAAGVWHARHYETGVLTPNHYRLLSFSALLGGVAGWNWYMLVNRDNWYMSPINEWGRVRGELYEVFKQVVFVYNEIHPPTLEKINSVAVTFNPLQHAARSLSHNSPILQALYDSDVDYDLYNPRTGKCDFNYLFYSGNQWLEESSQQNLRQFVEEGGTLVAFRDYPRKNDKFEPCSIIGFEEPHSTLFEFKRKFSLRLAASRPSVELVSSVYCFNKVAGEKITVDFDSYGKATIGYIKKVGKGKIIHIGVEPTRDLVLEILNYLKVPLAAHAVTRDVKTALFKRGRSFYLIATNNGSEDKSASVYLPALDAYSGKLTVRDITAGTKETISRERRNPFTFEIPRKDGKVFEFKV
jgi:hypothetical protein